MEMTQHDLDARAQRVDAGVGTDEDARLIKQYQRDGWSVSDGKGFAGEDGPETVDVPAGQEVKPVAPSDEDSDNEPDDGSTAHGRGRGRGRAAGK